MIDSPAAKHLGQLRKGQEFDARLFGLTVLDLTGHNAIERDQHMTAIREERGVRIDGAQTLESAGAVSRLLEELAGGGLHGRLTGIDQPTRNLEGHDPGPLPKLANLHELVPGRQRNHVHPCGRFDPVERMGRTGSRRLHDRPVDVENLAMLEMFLFEDAPG